MSNQQETYSGGLLIIVKL